MNTRLNSRRATGFICAFVITLACALTTHALAEEKPSGDAVELIVPFGPGGGADRLARESAKLLESVLPSPVTVKNIPGATGNTGMARLFAAPGDGRTMAVLTADTFSLLAYLNPGWKLSDIVPLAIMTKQPSAIFLPAGSRFKTWADFEKEARLRPDSLRVAITGFGSPDYLALQQLSAKGIRLAPVPQANPDDRYRAPFNGTADALYEQTGDVQSLIDTKQLRPILVFSDARLAEFSEVPASQELGLGIVRNQFRALVLKAGTDPARIKAMSESLDKVAAMPQYKGFLEKQTARKDSYVPMKDAVAFLQGELDAMKKIVDSLPFHARYIISESELQDYVEPF